MLFQRRLCQRDGFGQRAATAAAQIASERVAVCNVFPDQAYLAAMFHDCVSHPAFDPVALRRLHSICIGGGAPSAARIAASARTQALRTRSAVVGAESVDEGIAHLRYSEVSLS